MNSSTNQLQLAGHESHAKPGHAIAAPQPVETQSPEANARAKTLTSTRRKRSTWPVVVLAAIPIVLVLYKLSTLPGAEALRASLSLLHLSHDLQSRAMHLLAAPLGAMVVVFVRLTLGIRVLGPFRAVLLAVAFHMTGALVGISFFAIVVASVLVLKPLIRRLTPTYFGRSAATLTAVVTIILIGMMIAEGLGVEVAARVAYFPVVVLTLTGDAFATTLRREGPRSAIWRIGATTAVALLITAIVSLAAVRESFIAYPETVLLALVGIVLIARHGSLRLLKGINPKRVKKRKKPMAACDASLRMKPAGSHAEKGSL